MTTLTLSDSILVTLAYFDVFSYPLSKEEVFRFLWCPPKDLTAGEVWRLLHTLNAEKKVEEKDGYWFLPGKTSLVEDRLASVPIVEEKLERAMKAVKVMAWIPFLKAVFVCNTAGMGTAKKESDIDVFIVVEEKRLWFTRLLITLALSVTRMRRTKKRVANQICLSFFVTDSALNVEPLSIVSPDVYLMYWLDVLIPVYERGEMHRTLMEKNAFARAYVPHAFGRPLKEKLVSSSRVADRIKRLFEKMWGNQYGDLLESQAKAVQQTKMRMNTKSVQHEKDTRVVETDTVLKFHEHDRRIQYRDEWLVRCRALNIKPYDGAW
jgi:hypothetical protein